MKPSTGSLQSKPKQKELSQAELNQLTKSLEPKWSKYIPWQPTPKQTAGMLLDSIKELLYGGSAGGGKVQPYSAVVQTPFGERLMGDLKVGDKVCIPNGSSSPIIQIHEQGEIDVYRVTFEDGRSCEVGLEHIWKVRHTRQRAPKSNDEESGRWFLTDTAGIIELMKSEQESEIQSSVCVPLSEPIQFTKVYKYDMRIIHPYVLGVLIGDGSLSTNAVTLSTADDELYDRVKSLGYEAIHCDDRINEKTSVVTHGYRFAKEPLSTELKRLGLLGTYSNNKFIPKHYKYGTIEQRTLLMQGLIDTDGYVDSRGHISYTTVSEQLAKDVQWVVRSLGGRAQITDGIPSYEYKGEKLDGQRAYTVYIQIKDGEKYIGLQRKKDRRIGQEYNGNNDPALAIMSIEYVRKELGRCIKIRHVDGLYLTNDFVVTHNTVYLLMSALQYVDVPGYSAIIIRKTFSDLIGPKAPMSLAQEWLSNTDAKWNRDEHTWKFPSGAKLKFGYIESDNDVYQYQGHEYQFIGIDELTQHSEFAYSYVAHSRLRKPKDLEHYPGLDKVPLRIRATSNPGGKYHDWVKKRFLDDIKADPTLRRERMFLPAKLTDNKFINQEEYVKSLMNLDLVTREQLLNGNWEIRESGGFFKNEWVQLVDDYPHDAIVCRYWDLAATLAGDYTVGVKVAYKDGIYYVLDVQRMRATPLIIQNLVKTTAQMDGDSVHICMEQEPGSAGVNNIDFYAREVLAGYIFRADKKTGDKETRARVASAAMEHGNLKFIKGYWNRQFLDELIVFPTGEFDDCVDGLSGAIFELNRIKSGMVYHVGNLDFDLVPRTMDRGMQQVNRYG